MRTYAGMMAFVDLLFNLLLGFTVMFILAFLLINPPDTTGQIDPPIRLMITLEWDDSNTKDMDLWVRGYDERWVGFSRLDGIYFALERDDRGMSNDLIVVNGITVPILRNYEVTSFTVTPAGEYFVNVHYFSKIGDPVEVTVTVVSISPFKHRYTGAVTLTPDDEVTMVSFVVDESGKIDELRTDIQMLYIKALIRRPPSGSSPW
jgi:hypothetical protein